MSVRREARFSGQLALMDAMVFFAVVLLICSLQLSMYMDDNLPDDALVELGGRGDPATVLSVLLDASIGVGCVVSQDTPLEVPPATTVSECIAAELAAIMGGEAMAAFFSLNQVVLGIAKNISHPLTEPHIVLHHQVEGETVTLLRIERTQPEASNLYSACCDMPGWESSRIVLSLILEPTLLLESLDV